MFNCETFTMLIIIARVKHHLNYCLWATTLISKGFFLQRLLQGIFINVCCLMQIKLYLHCTKSIILVSSVYRKCSGLCSFSLFISPILNRLLPTSNDCLLTDNSRRCLAITSIMSMLNLTYEKGTLRKRSLHEKTAASVLLKLFISCNE